MARARAPSTGGRRGREPEATSEQGVLQQPGGLPPTVVAGTPSDAVAPGMVVVDAAPVPGTAVSSSTTGTSLNPAPNPSPTIVAGERAAVVGQLQAESRPELQEDLVHEYWNL